METLKELVLSKADMEGQIKLLTDRLDVVNENIGPLLGGGTTDALEKSGKDTGTVTFFHEGIQVRASLSKKVEWDQTKLRAIGIRISEAGDNPEQYTDTTYTFPEKSFAKWPEAVQKVFLPARTVKPGKPKYEFILPPEESNDVPF